MSDKKYLTVGDLRKLIERAPSDMEIWICSNDSDTYEPAVMAETGDIVVDNMETVSAICIESSNVRET